MSDDAIVAVALDYFEGWFDGDPARMERALHPELAKRGVVPDGLARTTAARMVELTAEGAGRDEDVGARDIDITVEDVHGEIARTSPSAPRSTASTSSSCARRTAGRS